MNKRKRTPPTREQLDAKNLKAKEKRAMRTPEQIELDNDKRKERYKNLSSETKEKYKKNDKLRYEKTKNLSCVKERKKEYAKKYKVKNKERLKSYNKQWHCEKIKTDELYKAKTKVRAIIKDAMRRMGYKKKASANQILGCTFDEFKTYLESKFESWMTWDNYGLYNNEFNHGWDIDHIIPINSANTIDELHALNHYTNLQPLCSKINRDIKR